MKIDRNLGNNAKSWPFIEASKLINNAENLGEGEVHKVTNNVANEIKSDSESEYIEIKISIRKR